MPSYRFEKLNSRVYLHGGTVATDSIEAEHTAAAIAESPSVETTPPAAHSHGAAASHSHHLGGDMPHSDDPVRGNEHQALLDLVPHTQVTHRAVNDGPWSERATWEDGELPTDGAHILIPHGKQVVVDGEFSARLKTIRVDGTLSFATDVNTSLAVDTFVVAVDGTLQIGTSQQPIAADVSANILFTDDGPIDTTWDPTVLSRGLLSHGNVQIYGAAKSGPVDLQLAPLAGDWELELADSVSGWQVGDRILIPGVVRPAENNRGVTLVDQDEIVTITAISHDGRLIRFDRALVHDHLPPREQLKFPIANLDRNVVFSSENTTDPQRAGHVMFMHTPDATVNYAAFQHIGRNDKSVITTDPQLDEHGKLIPGTGDNARGRYAVHFHRIGSEASAATVTGSVVENSPGWGFVNHDSHVVMRENVSYNVKGAGFVSEIGTERGAFISNLAVRSRGRNYYQPQSASDKGEGTGFGSAGHGFWLQSASVALIDNVASGHAQEGIFIHSRTVTEFNRDEPSYASLIDTAPGTPLTYRPGDADRAIRNDLIRPDQAPAIEISGNQVFASGAGMGVRWRRQVSAMLDGTDGDVIENFRIWNVQWAGIHLGYVSGLTLRDGVILGDLDDPIGLNRKEQSNRETETRETQTAVGKGIAANRNSRDLRFERLEVAGFTVGIQALTQGHTLIDSVALQNVENIVIVTPQATEQSDNKRRVDATNVHTTPLAPHALDGATPYNVRLIKQIARANVAGGTSATQEWAALTADDEIYYNGHRLYFHDQAADAVPFPSAEAPAYFNDPTYSAYRDRTNGQLYEEFGVALGAEVAPADAFDAYTSMGVDALAVELEQVPELPLRMTFGFDTGYSSTTWTLGESNRKFEWSATEVPVDSVWHIYLEGENGPQEIARTGLSQNAARVFHIEENDEWQTWALVWPQVGQLPDVLQGSVDAGEYSLIAALEDGPAVYLGRIAIVSEALPAGLTLDSDGGVTQLDLTQANELSAQTTAAGRARVRAPFRALPRDTFFTRRPVDAVLQLTAESTDDDTASIDAALTDEEFAPTADL